MLRRHSLKFPINKLPARGVPIIRALVTLMLLSLPATGRTQIFVTNRGDGTVGEYTLSGATINGSLISGLNQPYGIAVSGDGAKLFAVNNGTSAMTEYSMAGPPLNHPLGPAMRGALYIAVAGTSIFSLRRGSERR